MVSRRGVLRVVLVLLGTTLVVLGVTAVPAGSATPGPQRVTPRTAPDGILGSFTDVGGGLTQTVDSLTQWTDDTIVAGGHFIGAGGLFGIIVNYVAAYSDDTWHALSSGASSIVYAVEAWTDDTVVAGGGFTSAGGRSDDSYVAAWSGGAWGPLEPWTTSSSVQVRALSRWADDTLVAGGGFTAAGSVSASNIAAWSAGAWHALGSGIGGGTVYSLHPLTDDTLIVGGLFSSAGGVSANSVAAWSGGTWQALGAGLDGYAYALDSWNDDTLVAGGFFNTAGGLPASNIATWSDGAWRVIGTGLNERVHGVAVDDTRGLIYAAGRFTDDTGPSALASLKHVGVWDAGISAWIPLQWGPASSSNGVDGISSSSRGESLIVAGSNVFIGGLFEDAGGVAAADNIAKWTWQPPQAYDDSNLVTGLPVTLVGEGFIGVPAAGGVKFGGATASYVRDDSTHITVTSLSGIASPGAAISVDGVGGWGAVGTCGPPLCSGPPPAPIPPGQPRNVTATAADASATVTWLAPDSAGSYPVTDYEVTSSPGGKTCLASTLTCTVSGLTNGTTYTFTVRALSGAGWGPSSVPSNSVTPTAPPPPPTPVITITGARDGQLITVTGTAIHLSSPTVRPWTRFPGQTSYTEGIAIVGVQPDGTFTWSRKTNRKTYVYFAHGNIRSNRVTISAR